MYYPDEIVEEVLHSNNIVDVVSSYVHLQKKGSNYFGLCPFHNEKTASFSVSQPKQLFYCFGCGAGGNAATFLMKYENYSFHEALEALADRAGIKLPQTDYGEESRKKEEHRSELLRVNKETAVYYYKLLRTPKGRKGLQYFAGRALTPETVKAFGLGFADGSGNDLVKHLREQGFSDELILEAGVAVYDEKRGIHDKFWNRVMFPIQNIRGQVIGFGGRVMGDAKPKYLNSPETEIFDKSRNLYGLHLAKRSKDPEWILCEGYMDVIAMHQAGFTQAVASLGTAFTEGQAALIKRYVKTVCLAYDSDEAGVRAARRAIGILSAAGINAKVINMQPAKDPDEFIKKFGTDAFRERIRDAENSFFFELRMLQRQYRMDDPAQRTAFHREIAGKLCEFEDEIERENYLKEAASRYGMQEAALRSAVASYGRGGRMPVRRPTDGSEAAQRAQEKKKNRQKDKAQRYLLSWIADEPEIYHAVKPYISAKDFEEGMLRSMAEYLFDAIEKGAGQECAASLISRFESGEEQEEATAVLQERLPGIEDERVRARALRDLVYTIKKDAFDRGTASPEEMSLNDMIRAKKDLEMISKVTFSI